MTPDPTMATLDTMVMAGKEAPSEEPVPLVCPSCRGNSSVDQTTAGFIGIGTNQNMANCQNPTCRRHGIVADWLLIERLRRCVVSLSKGDRLEPLASQP